MPDPSHIESTVNHLFRHQWGRMVAVLTRIFGTHNLELAEDVVQETLMSALEQWKIRGLPQNPESWLFIVAKNKALNLIKRQGSSILFGDKRTAVLLSSGYTVDSTFNQLADEELIKDDQLRMMFACCHPSINEENRVTLILKTLCGFSTAEIARAFLTSEDTISKRLYRTKEFFRENRTQLVLPEADEIRSRTGTVLSAIYLLFNEGYNSTHSEELIRKDLIEEAVVLCKLLADNEYTQLPEVNALMALMCFHAARSTSRLSREGEIILLAEQDRKLWNRALIEEGSAYLAKASTGHTLSPYHLEAAIAFEHCMAESYDQTDWQKIISYYELLENIAPSPITSFNKAVAVLQNDGPEKALKVLKQLPEKEKLNSYHLYYCLLAEISLRLGKKREAKKQFESALALTLSEVEKRMLLNRMAALD
jgi:RNA polymerase sigma-70 factor (ECF subfamily)